MGSRPLLRYPTPMSLITSPSNARIKQARALSQRKQREASGLCVAEGIVHVGEALDAGIEVEYLVHAPDLLVSPFGRELVGRADARGIPILAVTTDVFESVAGKDNPQGLLAVVRPRRVRLEELGPERLPWAAALVAPQDPGNVGTIARTLDAVGASGMLLLDGGVDPYHPNAIRASMGTLFRLPVASAPFAAFADWAAGHGYHVYGTSARGREDYRAIDVYELPLVLLLGSEREGLSPEQAAACESMLRLSMHGRASSLNLAVAAGVFLYAIHDALEARGERPSPSAH